MHSQPSNNVGQKKNLMTSEQEYLMKRTFHSTKTNKKASENMMEKRRQILRGCTHSREITTHVSASS